MKSHKNKKINKKINKKNTKKINKNIKKIKGGLDKSKKRIFSKIANKIASVIQKRSRQPIYISQGNSRKQSTMYATPGEYSELSPVVYEEIPGSTNPYERVDDGYYETVEEPIYEKISNEGVYSNPQNSRKNSGVYSIPQPRIGKNYITIDPLYNMASSSTNSDPVYDLASYKQLSGESNTNYTGYQRVLKRGKTKRHFNNDPYANTRTVLGREKLYNTPQFVSNGSMNNSTYNLATIPI